ncbi:gluconolactonase [Sphingomonas sp. DBB INV C78]|uniref:SMP-30/gluconolactonase/LRE family protein n=1 Tax=Sphingomonas sp. DBB INV C78 TaxID=3349434 RepID=UPI0036D25A02
MTKVRTISRRDADRLGEGPLWSEAEQALYWVDILGQRLNRYHPASGAHRDWAMPDTIGWVIERQDGTGFVAGIGGKICLLSLDPFAITPIATLQPNHPGNRLNDAKADAAGRIWAGTMPMAGDQPSGSLFRLGWDMRVHEVDRGYCIANGPAISLDGRWLFHTDSRLGHVYRFPVRDDGSLGKRTLFIAFSKDWGSPDGMTFDAEGGLWIAHWGAARITCFDAVGVAQRHVDLPASQITSLCFGGRDLDRLYVTSASDGVTEPLAGQLFELDAGVRGLPAHRFAG